MKNCSDMASATSSNLLAPAVGALQSPFEAEC
jgi:hypothetical protein